MSTLERIALGGLLALAGCGDELATADYEGEPLVQLQGPISLTDGPNFIAYARCDAEWFACTDRCPACLSCDLQFTECVDAQVASMPPPKLNLGLFWSGADQPGSVPTMVATSKVRPSFPASWTLSVFTPPPSSMLRAGSGSGRYSLGLVLVWMDANFDGRWQRGADPIVGGAQYRAVLYTPDGLEDAKLGTFGPGYHPVSVIQYCGPAEKNEQPPMLVADDHPMEVWVTLAPEFIRTLLLDLDCDGLVEEFEVCPPEAQGATACGAADLGLCDLCRISE